MTTVIPSDDKLVHHDTLVLRVRYIAASKPYDDPKAAAGETLVELKPHVLKHFGLVEGDVEGGRKVYIFSVHDVIQTDLAVNLGSLARHKHELEMDLLEQFIQG
jgi:hypothetical protein